MTSSTRSTSATGKREAPPSPPSPSKRPSTPQLESLSAALQRESISQTEGSQLPRSNSRHHFTEIIRRTEIPLSLLINYGIINPAERSGYWNVLGANVELEFTEEQCQDWTTRTLQKVIEKIRQLRVDFFPANQEWSSLLDKTVFSMNEFNDTVQAVCRTYYTCMVQAFALVQTHLNERPEVHHLSPSQLYTIFYPTCPVSTEGVAYRKESSIHTNEDFLTLFEEFLNRSPAIFSDFVLNGKIKEMVERGMRNLMHRCQAQTLPMPIVNHAFRSGERILRRLDPFIEYLKPYVLSFEDGGQGELLYADALSLSMLSSYFEPLFFRPFVEGVSKRVNLPQMRKEEFNLFFSFAMQQDPPTWESILLLMTYSEQAIAANLFKHCCEWIISDTAKKTAIGQLYEKIKALGTLQKGMNRNQFYRQQWEDTRDQAVGNLLSQAISEYCLKTMIEAIRDSQDHGFWPSNLTFRYNPDYIDSLHLLPTIRELVIKDSKSRLRLQRLDSFAQLTLLQTLSLIDMDCSLVPLNQWKGLFTLPALRELEVHFPLDGAREVNNFIELLKLARFLKMLTIHSNFYLRSNGDFEEVEKGLKSLFEESASMNQLILLNVVISLGTVNLYVDRDKKTIVVDVIDGGENKGQFDIDDSDPRSAHFFENTLLFNALFPFVHIFNYNDGADSTKLRTSKFHVKPAPNFDPAELA